MNPNDPKGAAGALKTPLSLIPSYAMEQTAWVHKLGSDKYGPYNWRKTGVCASTYVNAILRHLNAWRDGETLDPESGISHLAHVACSCNILLDADHCGTLQDDRNITSPNTPISKMDKSTPIPYTEYRFLEVGELIQDGDQFYAQSIDHWFFTSVGHMSIHNTEACKYRRKVEPVENSISYTEYRLLKVGEIVQEGDEYYYEFTGDWLATGFYPTGELEEPYAVEKDGHKYRRKVEPVEIPAEEPEQPVETEYRFLKERELIQEGDEYWCCGDWRGVCYNEYGLCTVAVPNFYRRKDERTQDCTCGRIKINHYTLGWICEDCEWHGEPY